MTVAPSAVAPVVAPTVAPLVPPPSSPLAPHVHGDTTTFGVIRIFGSDDYQRVVVEDLERLNATSVGRSVLRELEWSCRNNAFVQGHDRQGGYGRTPEKIWIFPPDLSDPGGFHNGFTEPAPNTCGCTLPTPGPTDCNACSALARNRGRQLEGTRFGAAVNIWFNPAYESHYPTAAGESPAPRAPFVILAHELLHARNCACGGRKTRTMARDSQNFENAEEEQVICGVPYNPSFPSENALLRELGMPARVAHNRSSRCYYRGADGQWYDRAGDAPPASPGTRMAQPRNNRPTA